MENTPIGSCISLYTLIITFFQLLNEPSMFLILIQNQLALLGPLILHVIIQKAIFSFSEAK